MKTRFAIALALVLAIPALSQRREEPQTPAPRTEQRPGEQRGEMQRPAQRAQSTAR
jgi:hypothetical protein